MLELQRDPNCRPTGRHFTIFGELSWDHGRLGFSPLQSSADILVRPKPRKPHFSTHGLSTEYEEMALRNDIFLNLIWTYDDMFSVTKTDFQQDFGGDGFIGQRHSILFQIFHLFYFNSKLFFSNDHNNC